MRIGSLDGMNAARCDGNSWCRVLIDPHAIEVEARRRPITICGETTIINTGSEPILPRPSQHARPYEFADLRDRRDQLRRDAVALDRLRVDRNDERAGQRQPLPVRPN